MSQRMRAVELSKFGGLDGFTATEVAAPGVGAGQVRVRVHATSVNPLDQQIVRGDYSSHVPLPAILGHDVSGVVDAVGPDVTEFAVGDEVYYTPEIFGGAGAYAELHVAPVELVARKPASLSHVEAASLALVGGTVWQAFVGRAAVKPGETVLIHGGAGGVGHVAVQVARALGARVLATARARDHDFVRDLGAAEVIDYSQEDYVDAVARRTGGRGVDVVLDTIGGDALSRSPHALTEGGRLVSIVDTAAPQNLLAAWEKNVTYHFLFLRPSRATLDALTDLVDRGLLRPVVGAVVPLAEVARAHALAEARSKHGLRGKIAIAVASE